MQTNSTGSKERLALGITRAHLHPVTPYCNRFHHAPIRGTVRSGLHTTVHYNHMMVDEYVMLDDDNNSRRYRRPNR